MAVASTAAGILLGPPVQELLNLVKDYINKALHFRSYLGVLKSTLDRISSVIDKVDCLNALLKGRQISDIESLKKELEKGKDLVRKCSTVPSWNFFKRIRYAKKILKFDKYLRWFFDWEVQADIWHSIKQMMVEIGVMSKRCGGSCSVPEIRDKTFGLDVPLKELKRILLFRDDVKVLGLWAPGGCGKTTLATMLCRDTDVTSKFKKNIYFLTVTSSPDFKVMVQKLWGHIYPTKTVPDFLSQEEAIMKLGNLLTEIAEEPTLLVLDDVWEDSVVRKIVFGAVKYKILVTSRTQCQAFDYNYPLKMLSDEDAMDLFRYSAFPQNGDVNYEEPHIDLQNKIVSGCGGLPLALIVIGHSLCRRPPIEWQQKERMLSSCSIFYSHSDLLDCLASSLKNLKAKVQECFMDLGSFPEDEKIPASSLIDIWVELYGIDEVDAYINLLELSTLSLVSLIEMTSGDAGQVDGNLNGLFVTQHDLLRDLAIYKSQQNNKRLIMKRSEESFPCKEEHHFQNARLVSIQTGEMSFSNWGNMDFPEAEVLILDFSATNYTLPPFVEKMKKLKVLIIINHGRYCTQLNYLTGPDFLSTLRRVRLHKVSVPSLNEITEPLKDLQKISLSMCKVGQALGSFHHDFQILPNIVEINIDYFNDLEVLPQGICDLAHLQKLSITNCPDLSEIPEGIGSIRDLKVLRLHACTKLEWLPNSIQELKKLRVLDISNCLSMERLPEVIGELHGLEKLDMRGCSGLKELPTSIINLVDLKDVICDDDDEIADLWEPLKCHLREHNILHELNIVKSKDTPNLFWLRVEL